MDPAERDNILAYMKLFGHAPAGISPENLQLIKALQAAQAAGKQIRPSSTGFAAPAAPVTTPPPMTVMPGGIPRVDSAIARSGG
jgi:hypothetical protein